MSPKGRRQRAGRSSVDLARLPAGPYDRQVVHRNDLVALDLQTRGLRRALEMIDMATRFGTLDVLAGPAREGLFVDHGTGQVRD